MRRVGWWAEWAGLRRFNTGAAEMIPSGMHLVCRWTARPAWPRTDDRHARTAQAILPPSSRHFWNRQEVALGRRQAPINSSIHGRSDPLCELALPSCQSDRGRLISYGGGRIGGNRRETAVAAPTYAWLTVAGTVYCHFRIRIAAG